MRGLSGGALMSATLSIERLPGGGPNHKIVVIDCEHATTTLCLVCPQGERLPDHTIVRLALAQHRAEEPGCHCIHHLERRFMDPAVTHEA